MPNENLYETLGVDPAASAEEVRAAYRKRAKKAHPDTGGTAEEFQALSRALRILDDPEKRAKYDRGENPDDSPDNSHARMLSRVASLFTMVFSGVEERGNDATLVDIMDMVDGVLDGTIKRKEAERRDIEEGIRKLERRKGRFTGPEATVALLEAMLDKPIQMARRALKNINTSIEEDREVRDFLAGVQWRKDKPPAPDPRGNPYGSTDLDMETLRAMALNLKGAKPYRAYRYDSE